MIFLGIVMLVIIIMLIDAVIRMTTFEGQMKSCPHCRKWMKKMGYIDETSGS